MKEYTNEQIDILLQEKGYEKCVGYCMEIEAPEEGDNCFVSVDEVKKWLFKEPQVWYWTYEREYLEDLESCWERLVEDTYDTLETNDDKTVETYFDDILNNIHKKKIM